MKFRLLIVGCTVLVSACGKSPENVARQYWQGLINSDRQAGMEASQQNSQQELWRMVEPDKNSHVSFGETVVIEDETPAEKTATVETTLQWREKDSDKAVELQLLTVLEQENEQWKVNTSRTRQQFFTAIYRNSLQGLSATLAESLASFQVLSEDVAGELTQELDRAIEELRQQSNHANDDMQQFLEQLDEDLQQQFNSINR